MRLHDRFRSLLLDGWAGVFAQKRTLHRAIEHAMGTPCSMGRRTISRAICALGRQHRDWSADYKLFSRSKWDERRLFAPVLQQYLKRYRHGFVAIGFDDTKTPKTGKKIKSAFWQRDPMSPAFHPNLVWGLRFLQASALFPHHTEGDHDARGVPVRFQEAPALKKPGKRATDAERKAYKEAKKHFNLSTQALAIMRDLRAELDAAGARDRRMLAVLDGSFCNRTIFRAELDRIDLIARCRKDAKLCFPAAPGERRTYGQEKFTPQQIRGDETAPWHRARIYFAGAKRTIRYKEVSGVLWQRGAQTQPLRLFVIAPQPYKSSPNGRTHYRQPAYLLCTDLNSSAKNLIQAYFDRWQIEVNHREEKSTLGVGQAQLHADASVPRHPAFLVASYSLLLLAAIEQFGPTRTDQFIALPKWRKKAKRPSALDLITLLRKEINEMPTSQHLGANFSKNLAEYAYT
jgi:hypothetical protein